MQAQQKIIHLDADCFYAAVEMRDNPQYRQRPLAVGGPPDRRGVIATCNYEARAYGVKSAMSTHHALRLCPQLTVVPPDFAHYKAASKAIFTIYRSYTDLVEPLSLDEAYLDVTDCALHEGIATKIAAEIRQRVKDEVNLTVSAGVAPNKFLAKIASDWDKPDGLFVIKPNQIEIFIRDLPIERLHGVGPKTAARMHALGMHTCTDVRAHELPFLLKQFGKMGLLLHQLARGIDKRSVKSHQARKSVSVETTFLTDIDSIEACKAPFAKLYEELQQRVERSQSAKLIFKLFIKVRLNNFSVRSIETMGHYLDDNIMFGLLQTLLAKQNLPIRLLGLGVRLREQDNPNQFELLEP